MPTNAPKVQDATLRKFIDAMIECVVFKDGGAPAAAPNAFKDRLGVDTPPVDTGEFTVTIRTSVDGTAASIVVQPMGSIASALVGEVDLTVLAGKLA